MQRAAYFKPVAKRRVFIIDGAETMRWDHANIFLKILEEPPETATLILLAPNPYSLLPTIRSRCVQFFFSPLAQEQVEEILRGSAPICPPRSARSRRKWPREARAWRWRLNLAEAGELRQSVFADSGGDDRAAFRDGVVRGNGAAC